jgi:hypothetical protein
MAFDPFRCNGTARRRSTHSDQRPTHRPRADRSRSSHQLLHIDAHRADRPAATYLVDANATSARVRTAITAHSWVHLARHATRNQDDPVNSAFGHPVDRRGRHTPRPARPAPLLRATSLPGQPPHSRPGTRLAGSLAARLDSSQYPLMPLTERENALPRPSPAPRMGAGWPETSSHVPLDRQLLDTAVDRVHHKAHLLTGGQA